MQPGQWDRTAKARIQYFGLDPSWAQWALIDTKCGKNTSIHFWDECRGALWLSYEYALD
jgi:hypothetical protein